MGASPTWKEQSERPRFSVDKTSILARSDFDRLWQNLSGKHGCSQPPRCCRAPNVPWTLRLLLGTLERELMHTNIRVLLLMVWIHITVPEQQARPANRAIEQVWCCVVYETSWNHVSVHSNNLSIDKPNEDSWGRPDSKDWDRDGRRWRSISDVLTGVWLVSFYGIYSLIFIVETDVMTPWPAAVWSYVWSILEGQNSWELSREGEEDSHRSRARPRGHIRGHSGQKAISNDGWWGLTGEEEACTRKRVEPDGLRLCTH